MDCPISVLSLAIGAVLGQGHLRTVFALCCSLTISIVLGIMILQVWIASSFFLQPKMSAADKQKPLALDNR